MLTYQLQNRIFNVVNGVPFTFPNNLEVKVKFGPSELFGKERAPLRFMVPGSETQMEYNSNSGRVKFLPEPFLDALDVKIKTPSSSFTLNGDQLVYEAKVDDISMMEGIMISLNNAFSGLINVYFPSPPYAKYISGNLGDSEFRWEHKAVSFPFTASSTESLEGSIVSAFKLAQMVSGVAHRRLLASTHYLYKASRLIEVGESVWEFMSEVILNLCKSLEVLFGGSRDKVRDNLRELGYSETDIEGRYIPLMLLRNELDVGHVSLSTLDSEKLNDLYQFLVHAESNMKGLLVKVIESVSNEEIVLPEYELNSEKNKFLEKILESTN
jgi:hypothetical protein